MTKVVLIVERSELEMLHTAMVQYLPGLTVDQSVYDEYDKVIAHLEECMSRYDTRIREEVTGEFEIPF